MSEDFICPELGLVVWKIHKDAKLPIRKTEGSVGYDIHSIEDYVIKKNEYVIIKTGLVVKPPQGMHVEITLRSSLPKKGLAIPHGIGIIDQDYCGEYDELGIPVFKFSEGDYTKVNKGDRIAQLILRKTYTPPIFDYTSQPFNSSSRGGFGSTGDK